MQKTYITAAHDSKNVRTTTTPSLQRRPTTVLHAEFFPFYVVVLRYVNNTIQQCQSHTRCCRQLFVRSLSETPFHPGRT